MDRVIVYGQYLGHIVERYTSNDGRLRLLVEFQHGTGPVRHWVGASDVRTF